MKTENSDIINVDAIEREARKLRADYTARMVASARAWVAAKFSAPALAGSKAA